MKSHAFWSAIVAIFLFAACAHLPGGSLDFGAMMSSNSSSSSSSKTEESVRVNGHEVDDDDDDDDDEDEDDDDEVDDDDDDEEEERASRRRKKRRKKRGKKKRRATKANAQDIGATCKKNSECDARACFVGHGDLGYCTKMCNSWSDCPSHWECKRAGNAPQKICMQDD